MVASLRGKARWVTFLLGLFLALLHGPVELSHTAAHAQAIAKAQGNASADAIAAPPEACALCALAALTVALPRVERLLQEPPTQPWLVCLVLSRPESLRLAAPCFHPLRAPPAPTC